MYAPFFGLQQPPFSIAPDPRYLYMSERHREALAHLLYGVGSGGGFVVLTGEIGAGKTTVCRCLLEQVPPGCQVAYIFNPKLSVLELLQSVCAEFDVAVPAPATGAPTAKTYIDALNGYLLAAHAEGRHCVLIIDEAQNLSGDVLEQLRLLTNLETSERKLLQILLIGQPELRGLLASPGLEQLAQRVIARYHLGPLGAAETAAYVAHRMSVAGLHGQLPFEPAALQRVHALSGGVPRRINLLCDRALLGAYAENQSRVSRRIVERAAQEVSGASVAGAPARRPAGLPALALLLGGVLIGAAAAALWWRLPAGASAAGPGPVASSPPLAGASGAASASAVAPPASATALSAAASRADGAPQPATPASASAPAPDASMAGRGLPAWPDELLPVLDAGRGPEVFPLDEAGPWRELGALWGLSPQAAAGACQPGSDAALRCYRVAGLTLAQLRQLDRPALLALRGADGRLHHARLAGLGPRSMVLASGTQAWRMPLEPLARWWPGAYATLWRPPEGYARPITVGASGPAVDALARGLAALRQTAPPAAGQVMDAALAERLKAFQRDQGLQPDGVAGPVSWMLLARALGQAEPRLPVLKER